MPLREGVLKRIIVKLSGMAMVVLLVIGVLYGMAGITTINPGEVGLLIKMIGSEKERGMQERTLDTGMTWVEPIRYDVEVYDTRRQQYEENLQDLPSKTKDGQPVQVDLSLEIGLIDAEVPNLHETVGKNWYRRVVYPSIRSAIRNLVPSELSENVYTEKGRESIQQKIQTVLTEKFSSVGIDIIVNLRAIEFTNAQFNSILEKKAIAAQNVIIEKRNAEAAEQSAIKKENLANGDKMARIKAAEAKQEEMRLEGVGRRLQKEEDAKGILALATAEAEGVRLRREAYAGEGGKELVQIAWAENLGPNVKVWGIPTGAPGTASMMDLNGILKGAFGGVSTPAVK